MKKHFSRLAVLVFTLLNFNLFAQDVTFWSNLPNDVLAKKIVDQMTDVELYSQTLMFGWAGAEPDELLYQWVDRGLGNVKVFGWNTDDLYLVAKSVTSLQKASLKNRFQIPLLVATDQEGGWIRHVKGETAVTPGNMAIGASGYPADSWYSAYYICREIKALGINMNFAPTVDLYTNHKSTIIGTRSFGDDPDKVGVLGAAFASGSTAAGVLPTVKHFPGHGDTSLDSHGRLPVIDIDFDTFKDRELVPYLYLIKEKVPALMSGHLSYPKIDTSGAPASLSKFFLTDLLRNQLGYEGIIITDDMMMVGATIYAQTMSNAFKMALEAGNDIILSSTTPRLNDSLWTKNLDLMSTSPEFHERVKDAAYRVIKLKLDYFKTKGYAPLYPDSESVDNAIPDKEGEKFFLEQACRSITVNKAETYPLTQEKAGRIFLIGSMERFFTAAKQRYKNTGQFYVKYDAGPNEAQWVIDQLDGFIGGYDTIIVCVSNENHAQIANYLKNKKKRVIVLCAMAPTLADQFDWADTVLVSYSWRCDYSLEAMIGYLNGEYKAVGVKPYKD